MDKNIFRKLTYGLYIVGANYNNELAGCVVNTVVQITSENPIISVSINKDNYTNKIIKEKMKLSISVLSKNIDKEVISKFGFFSSKDTNKYENVNYELVEDLPVLNDGICGYIIGDVINIIDCNTHDIFLVKVTNSKVINEDEALTYDYYRVNMKGTSPKNAPTHIEEKIESNSKVYRCMICGHIYDDSKEKIKFEDLPDTWVCPLCGVGKDKFECIN